MENPQNPMVTRISEDIASIRRLMEIQVRDALRRELELVVTTPERRRLYALIDGITSTEDIAKKAGISLRSVQDILKKLYELDLVVVIRRGIPKRRFDWFPNEWKVEQPEENTDVIRP